MADHLKVAIWIFGLLAAILVASAAGEWLIRRKLERWAHAQGCQLLEFRGAPFWRGPRAWRRMDHQEDYRVVVEDPAGRRRAGWVLYTSQWYGLGPQDVEVRWDDSGWNRAGRRLTPSSRLAGRALGSARPLLADSALWNVSFPGAGLSARS